MVALKLRPFAIGMLALLAGATAPSAQTSSTLPDGASSLQEVYQDWQVACIQQETMKRCAFSQQQAQKDGQRILAIELSVADGAVSGTLILPFGLALDAGITLQVDEGAVGKPLRFSTCLPGGCIVPLAFDKATLSALRAASTLKVNATASTGTQPVALTISLKGFAAALDRTGVLAG